jgi:UDP-4-amino-4-deoxy-L-arabinose formyltransferase/UDP-glucuronic acid dehydrogenase (UDP-4-keto-hexauronic acid decarboxylating)
MKTIVLAYHNIGCAGIEALLRNGFDIQAVFTHRDDPGENTWFDSVAELAASRDLPVFAPQSINHPLWVQKIKAFAPDILFSFYYRNMVGSAILEIPPAGCLNLHGSLLPKYRGRCPVNWVLVNGETETGVTLHYMTPKPDDGDIVGQAKIPIASDDTAKTLHDKLRCMSERMLDDILPQIKAGTAPRLPQDHSRASYFGGRRPADGIIDWEKAATDVRNLVRAVTRPYPGAFSHAGDRKCFFWEVTEVPAMNGATNVGTVLSVDPLVIACGTNAVRMDFGQPDGGLYMSGRQLARELGLTEGMTFGAPASQRKEIYRKRRVLILGVNGFIGNALSERLLGDGKYEVHGLDLHADSISRLTHLPDFHFDEGDISIHREWIEYHIKKCDIVIPLVAIATPIEYTRNPIKVF